MLLFFGGILCLKIVAAILSNSNGPRLENNEFSQEDYEYFGTRWHVYVQTMEYDIVRTISANRLVSSCDTWQSLLLLSNAIPAAIGRRYSCQ